MIKLNNAKFVNRLAYLIATIAVILLLFSCVLYIVENNFLVEHITVTGRINRVTREQLINVAKNDLHGTMFTLNIDELQYEFKKIPWVKSVAVSRTFPDSITVNIEEYNAVAHYGDEGNFVSPNGQVFLGVIDDPTLPTFYGSVTNIPDMLNIYNNGNEIFSPNNLKITKVYWIGVGIARVIFSNNLSVTICGPNFADRLNVLKKYWQNLYDINPNLVYVNMCYKNAVAINAPTANIAH